MKIPREFQSARIEKMGKGWINIGSNKFGKIHFGVHAVLKFETKFKRDTSYYRGDHYDRVDEYTHESSITIHESLPEYKIFDVNHIIRYETGVECDDTSVQKKLEEQSVKLYSELKPEIEAELKKYKAKKAKQFAGNNAQKRIRRIQELIANTLKGVDTNLNPDLILKFAQLQSRFSCFSCPYSGSLNLWQNTHFIKHASDNDLNLTKISAMAIMMTVNRDDFVKLTKHLGANPRSVDLINLDHIKEAINLSHVQSIMEG